jgi:predicted  nucleic acid-binding Zn-ribbon protein
MSGGYDATWESIPKDLEKMAALLRKHVANIPAGGEEDARTKQFMNQVTLFAEELDDVRYRLNMTRDKDPTVASDDSETSIRSNRG